MRFDSAEQVVAEKIEDGDKYKRKNRRVYRGASSRKAVSSSVTEMPLEASEGLENGRATSVLTSLEQNNLEIGSSAKEPKVLWVEKLVNGSSNSENRLNSLTRTPDSSYPGAKPVSKPCSLTASQGQSNASMSRDLCALIQIGSYNQKQFFAPHWSMEVVNHALEKGDVFKAFFRVNAHNRLEAYCKIDGVPTDILISGVPSQNRAVEGDIVAVKVDPVSLWTRMKGATVTRNDSVQFEDSKPSLKCNDLARIDTDSSYSASFRALNGAGNTTEELCSMVDSFPAKRPTGKIVAVIERSSRRDSLIGFLNLKNFITKKSPDFIELTPNDMRFPTMSVLVSGLPEWVKKRVEIGDISLEKELIAARIDHWSEESLAPQACISHTFGPGCQISSHIRAILYENAICTDDFSPESLACVPQLPWEIPREDRKARRNLKNSCIFTIDPCTATDLDDALSIKRLSGGIFRVGIHIADASYFVLPNTELDKEAHIRSTSVYMLRRKLPMLPSLLSENLGSLNAGVDRLAFSVFLDINPAGDVVNRWIARTVIRSCCKLSYEQAQEIIDGMLTSDNKYPSLHGDFEWSDVVNSVKDLYDVSKILREKRFDNGALVVENSKISFLFDDCGDPYDSTLSERNASNFLVEEFMLLANKTVAEIISRAFPDRALLRKHPAPNARKLKEFEAFCSKHGLDFDASSSGKFHLSLQAIGEKLKDDSTLFDILLSYATKPMQLASYFCTGDPKEAEDEWGHYSLSVPQYTHFTSPLRRYPDLVVHRMLAAVIEAENDRNFIKVPKNMRRCFTGIGFEKSIAECFEVREALSAAVLKHGVLGTESLAGVAIHYNDRKLAGRRVADACNKLYMWDLLRRREVFFSEARVVGLGPKFMSIYIQKFAIERRIYYDEVVGLNAEWLEATSTLVLSLFPNRRSGRWRPVEDVALVVDTLEFTKLSLEPEFDPPVFPLTLRVFSKIPIVLHAIGGDDGPIDIGARLYTSSYCFAEIGCGKAGKGRGR